MNGAFFGDLRRKVVGTTSNRYTRLNIKVMKADAGADREPRDRAPACGGPWGALSYVPLDPDSAPSVLPKPPIMQLTQRAYGNQSTRPVGRPIIHAPSTAWNRNLPVSGRTARLPCAVHVRTEETHVAEKVSEEQFDAQVCVVLGTQWGDEGKGKLVDVLAKQYDIVARAQGGANAGHTIYDDDGNKYALHLVPSGILNPNSICLVGNGVVLHVPSIIQEMEGLKKRGVKFEGRLLISDRAHLLFDLHKEIDGLQEAELAGSGKQIGTTKRGIGPAYASKATRNGVRACDLFDMPTFTQNLSKLTSDGAQRYGASWNYDAAKDLATHEVLAEVIKPFIVDTVEYVNDSYDAGKRILIEGANATMLDLDFGTYPYVTSSNPSIGGIASGLGLSPNKYSALAGVVKAYTTRVGAGPYPTEVLGSTAEELREIGREYGTTTGRPRRIGWMDIVALRYVCRINGLTHLNLTKLDVLSSLEEIKIGVRYRTTDGRLLNMVPADLPTLESVTVEYETMPGWKSDISHIRTWDALPQAAKDYVNRLEELIGIHYKWIGVGPGRDALIVKYPEPEFSFENLTEAEPASALSVITLSVSLRDLQRCRILIIKV
eukprot:gene26912-4529_t